MTPFPLLIILSMMKLREWMDSRKEKMVALEDEDCNNKNNNPIIKGDQFNNKQQSESNQKLLAVLNDEQQMA